MCVCMCMYMYVCMYICIFVYTFWYYVPLFYFFLSLPFFFFLSLSLPLFQIAVLTKELASFTVRLQKCDMDISSQTKQEKDLTVQLETLLAKNVTCAEDIAKQEQLGANLAKHKKILTKVFYSRWVKY